MLKSELAHKISRKHPDLNQRDVDKIIKAVFDTIADGLKQRDRVELRGFGVFFVSERPARIGRNPRTAQLVQVEAKGFPFFKAGLEMRLRLNADVKKTE